jgi:hypothetical protein
VDKVKEFRVFENLSQQEAIINEFKGNLFEYLVGQELSKHYNLERNFLLSLDRELLEQLKSYESWLRKNNPKLILKLPSLAKELANRLLLKCPETISNVYVVGKINDKTFQQKWKEADILLEKKDGDYQGVSIKLCKHKAYVNTKSAGVKSFLQKYFNSFDTALFWQDQLSTRVDKSFDDMARTLYHMAGLDYISGFDQAWSNSGYSELPGQLTSNMKNIVYKTYHDVIEVIFHAFQDFYSKDYSLFIKCINPLLGHSSSQILQGICYHENYELKEIKTVNFNGLQDEMVKIKIDPLLQGKSSFSLSSNGMEFQVRVKPMNKFTTPGFKINCSVRRV